MDAHVVRVLELRHSEARVGVPGPPRSMNPSRGQPIPGH